MVINLKIEKLKNINSLQVIQMDDSTLNSHLSCFAMMLRDVRKEEYSNEK